MSNAISRHNVAYQRRMANVFALSISVGYRFSVKDEAAEQYQSQHRECSLPCEWHEKLEVPQLRIAPTSNRPRLTGLCNAGVASIVVVLPVDIRLLCVLSLSGARISI